MKLIILVLLVSMRKILHIGCLPRHTSVFLSEFFPIASFAFYKIINDSYMFQGNLLLASLS